MFVAFVTLSLQHITAAQPLQPTHAPGSVWLRCVYEGGTLSRDSWLVRMPPSKPLTGHAVLNALGRNGVDLARHRVRLYDMQLQGWAPCDEGTSWPSAAIEGGGRVDLQLSPRTAAEAGGGGDAGGDGYFLMGAYGIKNAGNVGTLWRSSAQLGASGLFTIGQRCGKQATDTTRAELTVPLVEHADWNAFAAAAPRAACWVGVEMGGEPLQTFEHPPRAVYILGAEDTGLPPSIARACHRQVALPSVRQPSYNVAVAGAIVMYDRLVKGSRRLPSSRDNANA